MCCSSAFSLDVWKSQDVPVVVAGTRGLVAKSLTSILTPLPWLRAFAGANPSPTGQEPAPRPPDSAPCWPSLHFAHPFCKPQCNAIFQFCAEEAEKLFSLGPGVESHAALGLGLYHQYSLQDLSVWFLSAAGTGLPLPGGRDPLDLDAVAHLGLLSSPSQISSCFSWSSSFGGQAQGARLPELVACWVMRGNKKLKEILSHTVPDWGATCKLW